MSNFAFVVLLGRSCATLSTRTRFLLISQQEPAQGVVVLARLAQNGVAVVVVRRFRLLLSSPFLRRRRRRVVVLVVWSSSYEYPVHENVRHIKINL